MTTFTLVGIFQVRENYGAHDWDGKGSCPQQWKSKGGIEHLLADLTAQEVIDLGTEGLRTLALHKSQQYAESNNYFETWMINYELVHVDAELIENVRHARDEYENDYAVDADPIGIAMELGITEYAATVALERLAEGA